MKYAIIADIHANLEALLAVLEDSKKQNCTHYACLGDVVGYGPNPLECMDTVMQRCEFSLMGNHDFAVLYEPTSFDASAESAAVVAEKLGYPVVLKGVAPHLPLDEPAMESGSSVPYGSRMGARSARWWRI